MPLMVTSTLEEFIVNVYMNYGMTRHLSFVGSSITSKKFVYVRALAIIMVSYEP